MRYAVGAAVLPCVPRLIVPIIWQILTPHRGTKRQPDALTRANGGRLKLARNAARIAESAADELGDEGDGGEQ